MTSGGSAIRALLNFARLPDELALRLSLALRRHGIDVVAITSHRGEDPRRFGSSVTTEFWHDYRPRVASERWRRPALEEVLSGREIIDLLPMVERPAPRLGGSAEAVWRLRSDLARASALLDAVRPDVMLSLDYPEGGLDTMLHRLGRANGVSSVWIRRGLTAFSRCATTDPFTPLVAPDGGIAPGVIDLGGASSAAARDRVQASLERMARGADPDVIPHVRKELVSTSRATRILRRLARRSATYNIRRRARPVLGGRRFLEELRDQLEDVAVSDSMGSEAPTALLALHYQPELSTLTLGSWGSRQLEVAKILADHLPSEWRLLVKEHPSTFAVEFSKTTVTYRPPDFYKRLAGLPRAVVLPLTADIRRSWDRIALVATTTGTIGLEALAVGCPVVHFGAAPYTNFRGAVRLDSPDPAALHSAVESVVKLDRGLIAAGFADTARRVESVSHQNASAVLQERMVAAMEIALERWSPEAG